MEHDIFPKIEIIPVSKIKNAARFVIDHFYPVDLGPANTGAEAMLTPGTIGAVETQPTLWDIQTD